MTSVSELLRDTQHAHILFCVYIMAIAEELSGGEVDVDIKVDFIPFHEQYAICDLLEMFDMKCPLKPFQGSNSTTQDLPSIGVR